MGTRSFNLASIKEGEKPHLYDLIDATCVIDANVSKVHSFVRVLNILQYKFQNTPCICLIIIHNSLTSNIQKDGTIHISRMTKCDRFVSVPNVRVQSYIMRKWLELIDFTICVHLIILRMVYTTLNNQILIVHHEN